MEVKPGLYLLGSRLGWILAGRTNTSDTDHSKEPSLLILTVGQSLLPQTDMLTAPDPSLVTQPNLESFWSLEGIGIRDSMTESDDDRALKDFYEGKIKNKTEDNL